METGDDASIKAAKSNVSEASAAVTQTVSKRAVASLTEPTNSVEVRAWYVYDFANSPFYQVLDVMSKVLLKRMAELSGTFPTSVMSPGSYPPVILWITAVTQTVALLSFAPFGDFGHRRKQLLMYLTFIGSGIVFMYLFLFVPNLWALGGACRVFGGVCHLLSNTYYTAFLPLLANSHWSLQGLKGADRVKKSVDLADEISNKGFMIGYTGGITMQIVTLGILILTESPEEGTHFQRLFPLCGCIALVGIWWSCFSIYTFRHLKPRPGIAFPEESCVLCLGWKQTAETVCYVISFRDTLLFLISYFLWSDALNTCLNAGILLLDESSTNDSTVIVNSLLGVFAGLVGLGIFMKSQQACGFSSKSLLMGQLCVAAVVSVAGGLGAVTTLDGFGLYFTMGPIMIMLGSLQANARSLFSSLSPLGMEAAMFSLFTITDKGSTLIGALVIAVVHTKTGSYVGAFWYTLLAFAVSAVLLFFVDIDRGMKQAGKLGEDLQEGTQEKKDEAITS